MGELRNEIDLDEETLKLEYQIWLTKSWNEILNSNYIEDLSKKYVNYKEIIKYFCVNDNYLPKELAIKLNIREFDHKYNCVCGYITNLSQSMVAHKGHCKEYRKFNNKNDSRYSYDRFKSNPGNRGKGFPWSDNEFRLRKSLEASNTRIRWNQNKPIQPYINQSNTRKLRYKSGELTPAPGVGRGKYSYVISHGNKWMLRSTYEFIVAIYLHLRGYVFEVEKIRLKDFDNHVNISDFNIGNRVFEVKSHSEFIPKSRIELFNNNGYKFYIIDWKIVEKLKIKLMNYELNIDELISKVIDGHNSKNYFVFNLDELKLADVAESGRRKGLKHPW